jgi:hypothetical protein
MQSFICCFCDLLWVLLVLLPEDGDDDGVLVLG